MRAVRLALAAALTIAAATGVAQPLFGAKRDAAIVTWPDPAPAPPALDALLPFDVEIVGPGGFAIDPRSITVIDGRAVRFTLVITSSAGTRNISHEAFHCDQTVRRTLAIGRPDGSWSRLPGDDWRPLRESVGPREVYRILYAAMCAGGEAVTPVSEIERRLRERWKVRNG